MLTGGFSEVNRAPYRGGAGGIPRRLHRMAGSRTQRLYRPALSAYWLKVEPAQIRHARFLHGEQAGHKLAINVGFDEARGVTELTIRQRSSWLLSIIAGACASAGANIVDAQIYTTTDGRARHHRDLKEYDRDETKAAATGSAR